MGSFDGKGGVARKLGEEKFDNWISQYITEGDLESIVKAHGDTGRQLEIIDGIFERCELPDSFTDDIYINERKAFLKRLENKARSNLRFRGMIDKMDLGFAPGGEDVEEAAPVAEAPAVEKEPVQKAMRIRQMSEKGVYYERGYVKWTNRERLYVKSRMDDYKERKITMTQLKQGLKGASGNERTSSSISTKMRRIRNEENKIK